MIDKPAYGSPCNHCGLCCRVKLCPAAEAIFSIYTPAPCPALFQDAGSDRQFCGLVLMERATGQPPVIADRLGIGVGCSMMDDDTTNDERDALNLKARILATTLDLAEVPKRRKRR